MEGSGEIGELKVLSVGKCAAEKHKNCTAEVVALKMRLIFFRKMSVYVCNTLRRVTVATVMYIDAVTLVCKPVG